MSGAREADGGPAADESAAAGPAAAGGAAVVSGAAAASGGQEAMWNGAAGRGWVAAQELLDRMYQPFADLLASGIAGGDQVLDVGCGAGATTLAAARRAGAGGPGSGDPGSGGHCVGVDISELMVAAARAHVRQAGMPAEFVRADAASHPFPSGGFDVVISRFGVMFFDDPVAAFTNLRRATRGGGTLRFVSWRSPAENPLFTAAERAAATLLPSLARRDPNAPGPFSLARQDHTERLLADSGWAHVEITPVDEPCSMSGPELEQYITLVGPVSRLLPDLDEATRSKVLETVRAAFEPFRQGDRFHYTAACWDVHAATPTTP
ncbi:class I SAM-dependent methyltransferase [Frankia sp. R82]|uniref:class I SAM-dependent methyltransferase n=1 Tax=Frankia sp. R82 TaxID=2950553 RepID=UPI002044A4AC|nr:class I SAM-dependent methyltransferase [Frankia sp. R82]MCM3886870.1 class I SAM-dependent methyltransferase [Frankia sp. R82]